MYRFGTEFMHKSILDFLDWNSWLDCHVVMLGIHDSPCINSSYFKHEIHDNPCTNSLYFSLSWCVSSCSNSCMSSSMNPNIHVYILEYFHLNSCTKSEALPVHLHWGCGSSSRKEGRAAISVCPLNLSHCHFFSQSLRCHRHYRQAMNPAGSANSDGYQYWHWSKRIS